MKWTKSPTWRPVAIFIGKLCIGITILYWLFASRRIDLSLFLEIQPDASSCALILVAMICVFVGLLLLALRLKVILAVGGICVPYKLALRLTLLGSLIGSLLPGLIGGDAFRAGYLCVNVPDRKADAVMSVIVDRIIGLFGLFVLGTGAVIGTALNPSIPFHASAFLILPLICAGFALAIWVTSRKTFLESRLVARALFRCPEGLRNLVVNFRHYFASMRTVMWTTFLSVINHALVVTTFVVSAVLVRDSLPVIAHFIISPLAMTMNGIGLTPGGIGLTESVFSLLFFEAGSPYGGTIGLMGRGLQYGAFLVTGLSALFLPKAG
jgi:uncharacterized protein (TIRG00374 family)